MSDVGPKNAVDNPILNSPFTEPTRYYDFSGVVPRILDGRRPAGYHGTVRTERMGQGAIAEHELFPLPIVNEIRSRVRTWRERGYPNVTPATRDLLDHWNRSDRRPLFFCQRDAVETVIWLIESTAADRQGLDVPLDAPNDLESARKSYAPLRRYCTKMATGSGKTVVMAMVAAWSIINKTLNRQDARFCDAILVVGPNLTVKERLHVLQPQRADNYYEDFDLVPRSYRDALSHGRVHVTNWHTFAPKDDSTRRGIVQRGKESDASFVRRVLGKSLGGSQPILVLNDEAHHAYRQAPPPAEEEEDERFAGMSGAERKEAQEFAEEATVWIGGLDRINQARGIRHMIDLSATPFYIKGSGHEEGTPLPWIVSDFGLVDAIESGITKVPRIPIDDNSGRPDPKYFHLWRHVMSQLPQSERETIKRRANPEAVWQQAQGALTMLAGKWQATSEHFAQSGYPVPPAMIVVAANTNLAAVVAAALKRGDVLDALKDDSTFQIDSKVLAEAESADEGGSKDDEKERLRLKTGTIGKARWPDDTPPAGWEHLAEPPGKNVRCVVSVGMLTEGWDAQNVTQILGLRAFTSQLLCEQVVGRGLRRMNYEVDPATGRLEPEYCDVFGIPFEVIPVQGANPKVTQLPPPSALVQALDERKHLAIDFPRVEGFVVDVKQRIRCDVSKVPTLAIRPQIEPTEVIVRTQMGWAVGGKAGRHTTTGETETLTRERFYDEHRLQRTLFEIARDITEVLAGGKVSLGHQPKVERRLESARLLFPQILAVVQEFVAKRVSLAPDAHIEEIALAQYRDVVVERLLAAVEPDVDAGETAILPRLDRFRPIGSTAGVQFRTTKPTKGTQKSHISHVVLDSGWEGSAAYELEVTPAVKSYAKNDRLEFEVLYEWRGQQHKYIPDFLVRVEAGAEQVTLILEMKGYEDEQDRMKSAAVQRWVRAVNNHGGFGTWSYLQCKQPNRLRKILDDWYRGLKEAGIVS